MHTTTVKDKPTSKAITTTTTTPKEQDPSGLLNLPTPSTRQRQLSHCRDKPSDNQI
jgi:hypothetical protein